MSQPTSRDIRSQFIKYFEDKEHKFVPSAPVIPHNDPTLLFTNAGMNQFKPIFLGQQKPEYQRAVNSQKCIRVSGKHNDLEEVGHDTYHHTFFEMLGNWSFGDYYKSEAIRWAWDLFTSVWGLPKDRLYATVYKDDDEAFDLWKKVTDIHPDHVMRFGEKDNFWEMGETGPCGPCSEIHIDLTKEGNGGTLVNKGSPDVIELWNLVFIQYNRQADRSLVPLPSKHVDTGAGFERIVRVLQQKTSNYDIDIFQDIIQDIERHTKKTYADHPQQASFRVIADHIRMLTFSITDGAIPGNEGRGYVLRRILRRAALYARKLEMHEPFIYKLVAGVTKAMGEAFPEIKSRQSFVEKVLKTEEENFNNTLDRGLEVFEDIAVKALKKGQSVIEGTEVFKLYDTFGFPLDLTRIVASEKNLAIDEEGARAEMEKQKQRSREEGKKKFTSADVQWTVLHAVSSPTVFMGYETLESRSRLLKYHRDGKTLKLVFDKTPFYGESGGQVGDTGTIRFAEQELEIWDTQKIGDDIVHFADDPDNLAFRPDMIADLKVTDMRRQSIAKNHSATHLVHAALRQVLGTHVQQSGSVVEPDRLRFDYTHFEKMTDEQIEAVERIVNNKIRENIPLTHHRDIPLSAAKQMGALSFFGDKYGEKVNVVQFSDYSKEFCGGVHVRSTGQIGYFRITIETSVAAGIRRIEAVTGDTAERLINRDRRIVDILTTVFSCQPEDVLRKVDELQTTKRELEKDLAETQLKLVTLMIDEFIIKARMINGVRVVSEKLDLPPEVELKDVGDKLREKLGSGVGILGTMRDEVLSFVCVVTDDLVREKKWNAGHFIKEIAKEAGGSGGGRPHLATAGARDVSRFDQAMKKIFDLIR